MSIVSATFAARPVTLEQLAALSDEIAALTRAGVPLDRGLKELARDMPGRLGKLAGAIGNRLEAGHSLDQIAAELETSLPPAYRSVIAAGLRAGRLPAALEAVACTARRVSQFRDTISLALLYPLLVLVLTWVFGLLALIKIAPVTAVMLAEFDVTRLPVAEYVERLTRTVWWWGPLVPLVIGSWLALVWYRSGRVTVGIELHPILAGGAVGTLARMQRASRLGSFTEVLALLIENNVPIPEALELASASVGSPVLARTGKELAERARRGETIEKAPKGFPPLLVWALSAGQSPQRLCRSLRRIAEVYREEISRRSQWLALYVPLFLIVVVCGGLVAAYAAVTLGPWIAIMRRLALPY